MTEKDDQVAEHFAKLDAQIKNNQNKKALKKLGEILELSKADEDALRCKVYVLIQGSQFSEALGVLQGNFGKKLTFEKAYCLYRVGKLQEALQALKNVNDADKRQAKLELEGQLHYRMGNHKDAIKVFKELVGDMKVQEGGVKANLLAAYVWGGQGAEIAEIVEPFGISSSDGFEVAFNQACGMVDAGNYVEAKEQLELALREGQEELYEEECSPGEIELGLFPLNAQLAYVKGMLGKEEEAMDGYKSVLETKGIDQPQKIVAEHNLFSEKTRSMPDQPQKKVIEEGLKRVEKLLDEPSVTRLTPVQKCIAMCNHALLLLLAGKFDVAKDTLTTLTRTYPGNERVKMVKAGILAKEKKFSEAEKVIQELASSGGQLRPLLMRAQLLAANGSLEEAVGLLSGIQDPVVKNSGAMIATRALLFERVSDFTSSEALAKDSLDWWKREGGSDKKAASTAAGWCLDHLAGLALREGNIDGASKLYREALECQVDDVQSAHIASKLSRVLAITDPSAVDALESGLLPVREFDASEMDDLEGSIKGVRRKDHGLRKRSVGEGGDKPKRKRARKPRLPKGFDPANPGPMPDPERWLPKWQRSGYKKPKRRRRDEKEMKGSQGAGKVNESLDRTKASGSESASTGKTSGGKPNRPGGAGRRRGRK
ncbi:hypothetical protein BSKO_03670 [Bryopsis sp. KO-2023]|nr:hypothetical protein BSKO_03670 [Bryopsis sp. KO-2023]